MSDSDLKNQIDDLKKSVDETEEKIRLLNDKCSDLISKRQELICQFILENKILTGTEWKFRIYGDVPRLVYNSTISKTDPLQAIIDFDDGDSYCSLHMSEGVTLQLDNDRASIQFSEVKHIHPFCQKFGLKVLPGNLIGDLNKLIREMRSLEIVYHAFNFKATD